MLVYQAFRFELSPNNPARSALSSHAGAARFAYNWRLAAVCSQMMAYESSRVLALREGAGNVEAKEWATAVVGPLPCTLPALSREWNRAKYEVAPWWASNSKVKTAPDNRVRLPPPQRKLVLPEILLVLQVTEYIFYLSARARASARGQSEEEYLSQFGVPLSPEVAGAAVVELVRTDAASVSPGYLLSGDGLQELP